MYIIDNFTQWLNAYPSRKYVIVCYVLLIVYVYAITTIKSNIETDRELAKRYKKSKRYVYCIDKKSNVAYVDLVTQFEFDNLLLRDETGQYNKVGLPIIDRNTSSTYFLLS